MVPEVSSSTTTVRFISGPSRTSNETDGSKSGPGSVSHASEVTAATWLLRSESRTPCIRAGTFCRSARP
ncbi:Uncharacterised protein [Mycobacterium tuberculosis]|nr:Uncharacterised protein [Mycobacterium tuberculosis]